MVARNAGEGLVLSFRLWEYSPHRPWFSWLVLVPSKGALAERLPRVIARAWDGPGDRRRLDLDLRRRPTTDPTVAERDAEIPENELALRQRVASMINLPLTELRAPYGTPQVAEFGLEGYRSRIFRLEWGAKPAEGLVPIAMWAAEMRGFLRGCLAPGAP